MLRKLLDIFEEYGMYVKSTELSASEYFLRFHPNMQKECYMVGQIEKKENIPTLTIHIKMDLNTAETFLGNIHELIENPERLAELKQLYDEVEKNRMLLIARKRLMDESLIKM